MRDINAKISQARSALDAASQRCLAYEDAHPVIIIGLAHGAVLDGHRSLEFERKAAAATLLRLINYIDSLAES